MGAVRASTRGVGVVRAGTHKCVLVRASACWYAQVRAGTRKCVLVRTEVIVGSIVGEEARGR
jgi:hypothetical protein